MTEATSSQSASVTFSVPRFAFLINPLDLFATRHAPLLKPTSPGSPMTPRMTSRNERFVFAYRSVLTVATIALLSAFMFKKQATFDEITVRRINIVEPDGTLRMVISNHAQLPGIVRHGKEEPFARPQAGMIFYNDEASEVGGLIFGGRKTPKGDVENSGGSLSFDRYDANQVVQLIGVHDKEDHSPDWLFPTVRRIRPAAVAFG